MRVTQFAIQATTTETQLFLRLVGQLVIVIVADAIATIQTLQPLQAKPESYCHLVLARNLTIPLMSSRSARFEAD